MGAQKCMNYLEYRGSDDQGGGEGSGASIT